MTKQNIWSRLMFLDSGPVALRLHLPCTDTAAAPVSPMTWRTTGSDVTVPASRRCPRRRWCACRPAWCCRRVRAERRCRKPRLTLAACSSVGAPPPGAAGASDWRTGRPGYAAFGRRWSRCWRCGWPSDRGRWRGRGGRSSSRNTTTYDPESTGVIWLLTGRYSNTLLYFSVFGRYVTDWRVKQHFASQSSS